MGEAEPNAESDPTPEETMARLQEADSRVRLPLTREINIFQLADELGVALVGSETEIVIADPDSAVTEDELRAALQAHTPDPNFGRDPDDLRAEELAAKTDPLTDEEKDEALKLMLRRSIPNQEPPNA